MDNKLQIGDIFIFKGYEWKCLDIIDGNYFCVTNEIICEHIFDLKTNNWYKSSAREYLNTEFLKKIGKQNLVPQIADVLADNGDDDYICGEKDYVIILSCDQYRKYKKIMPLYKNRWWTCTPCTCNRNPDERFVYTTGSVGCFSALVGFGIAPACLFKSNNLTIRRSGIIVEEKQQSNESV